MSYVGKVVEIMKTRKGKLFTLLLVLTVIFTFTGIAYGTSESVKEAEDPIVSEETMNNEVTVDQDEGDLDDGIATVEEASGDDAVESDGTDADDEADKILTPMVVTDGVVVFNVEQSDQAEILYQGNVADKSVTVDPEGISAETPFTFTVKAADGYEIEEVSYVSTFNDRAKPFVPATSLDGEQADVSDLGATPVDELSDELAAALEDTTEKSATLEAAGEDSSDVSAEYTIDDMAIFAGRDVVIKVKMKEIEFDAWYKVVDAFANGQNVKLTQDLTAGEDPQVEGATAEQIERNKQPAVVKAGSNVTLDLNGCKIDGRINDKGALLQAEGAGTTLTITDPNSTPIYGGSGAVDILADDAGKLASWDSGSRTLTYYLTDTLVSGDTSVESCLTETIKVPDNAGSIVTSNAIIVSGKSGSTINIQGGMLTSSNQSAVNTNASTLSMTGGYIVGSGISGDHGGAINAANCSLTIAGSAVIAGNTAKQQGTAGGNGGGIAIFATNGSTSTTEISGDAVIAGNIAEAEDSSDKYNRPKNGLGGGIYTRVISNSNVVINVSGNAVIAGNKAKYDGGGIYHEQGTLNLSGSAFITNNTAVEGQTETKSNGSSYPVHYGGGGIFSLDLVKINGNVKVTSNKAGGSGGGLLMTTKDKQVTAVLKMESGYFAGNLAETNEGGAMCLTTKGADGRNGSYIYSGYITNNKTATTYDYGGGGIFVTSSGGELYIYNPLVTKNSAEGSGGGVAACQNGIVISSHAAIFDNSAEGKDVLGDHAIGGQWPSQLGFDKQENYINVDGKFDVDGKYAASDFYGARESIIYNDMLAMDDKVGTYNWKGFMSGSNTGVCASAELSNNSSANNHFVLYDGQGGIIANMNIPAYFSTGWVNDSQTRMTVFVPKSVMEEAGLTTDDMHDLLSGIDLKYYKDGTTSQYRLTVDSKDKEWVVNNPPNTNLDCWAFQCDLGESSSAQSNYSYGGNLYNADGTVNTEGWERYGEIDVNISSDKGTYEIYKINEFPGNEKIDGEIKSGYAEAKRMMGLVAFPSDTDKQNARDAARLVISGNFSAANGGGIAVNGKTTIGRDPKSDEPDEPGPDLEPKFGSLNISKFFDNAIDQSMAGKATVLFKVNGYLSENHYRADKENPYYSDVFEINFVVDDNGRISTNNSVVLRNLPVNAFFVVEEISDSGFNTTLSSAGSAIEGATNIKELGSGVIGVIIVADTDSGIGNSLAYHNTYDPDKPYNDSIQNNWHKDMTGRSDQGEQGEGSETPSEE